MTIRRLINMLAPLSQGGDTKSIRNDALSQVKRPDTAAETAFFEKATVVSVTSNGALACALGAGNIDVTPETDDTFQAGQDVWVSRTKDGRYVCHGAVTTV
jgi:hypothetical protein